MYHCVTLSDMLSGNRWVEMLAQHLVREKQFIKIMQNAPDLSSISISKKWLSTVNLPYRYNNFDDFKKFDSRWWSAPKGGIERRLAVVQRAIKIYSEKIGMQQTSIEKTYISAPSNDEESNTQRESIFLY